MIDRIERHALQVATVLADFIKTLALIPKLPGIGIGIGIATCWLCFHARQHER